MKREREVVWFGLVDCEGICDSCSRNRKLTVQYAPTDAWLCADCFRDTYQELLAS